MSMNAYEAAWEWTARASAHTMAVEMADRWWRRNDLGEARPVPYTVASCPSGEATRLARARKRRTVLLLSAPDDSVLCGWWEDPISDVRGVVRLARRLVTGGTAYRGCKH